MLTSLFVDPFRNLFRGERAALLAAVLGIIVGLLFAVGVSRGQEPSRVPNSRVAWKPDTQWPGWLGLWIDGAYAGSLQPYEGKWWYQGANKNSDLIEFMDRNNPPRPNGERGAKVGDLKAKAGVREEDDPPIGDRRDQGPSGPLFGVVSDKIAPDGKSHYSIGGLSADRADALRAIETASGIPDDRAKPRLIVIGTEVGRKQVIDDLAKDPHFTYWRDKIVVLQYPPNHDAIAADRGFVQPVGDNPVIQAQGPDGTVYWRQETYSGAQELAKALRDKVPGYDPAKDPHPPDKGKIPSAGEESPLGLIAAWLGGLGCPLLSALGVGGGAAGAWYLKRRKAS